MISEKNAQYMGFLRNIIVNALDLLFPPRKTDLLLRNAPQAAFEALLRPKVIGDGEALLPYDNPQVRALIWELKYYDSARAAEIAGRLLAEHTISVLSDTLAHRALLIPVPMHKERLQERGYNQSERIARQMLPYLHGHVDLQSKALQRIHPTQRQTELKKSMRLRNVAGAFSADESLVSGKTCILLDDVVTTGATLTECSKTLLRAGASRVIPLALAYA